MTPFCSAILDWDVYRDVYWDVYWDLYWDIGWDIAWDLGFDLVSRSPQAQILVLAALLDFCLGDPWGWPHPVQGMGWIITTVQTWVLLRISTVHGQRLAGIALGLMLTLGSGMVGWGMVQVAQVIHPWLGTAIATVLFASCLAGRSLRHAATDVLSHQDLEQARQRLSLYVGRDTAHLSEAEILRAVLETVTENATDGVLAPLFYGLVGVALGVGAVPLALAYKAASTLDSMIGYRETPYTYIGWFSAKLEDGLTWLPCRAVVLTLACLSGRPGRVLHLCCRDAPADPSPNAGWSECAYAAILGVQLGGINWYRGVPKLKPLLGNAIVTIERSHIAQALNLTRICFVIWLALGCMGVILVT